MTILIVEDEAHMLRLLARCFSRHSYRVFQALDGEQAVDPYRGTGTKINTILLDVRLPKKSGEQVFRRLR